MDFIRSHKAVCIVLLAIMMSALTLYLARDSYLPKPGITVSFHQKTSAPVHFALWYKTKESDEYTKEQLVVEKKAPREGVVSFELPITHLHQFRLDFPPVVDAELTLSKLKINDGEKDVPLSDLSAMIFFVSKDITVVKKGDTASWRCSRPVSKISPKVPVNITAKTGIRWGVLAFVALSGFFGSYICLTLLVRELNNMRRAIHQTSEDIVKPRLDAVDSVRFILSVIIVYFHLLFSNMEAYIGNTDIWVPLRESTRMAWVIVECFLVMGGYFIYVSWSRHKVGVFSFLISRVARLWPVFVFYLIAVGLLHRFRYESILLDAFFLRNVSVTSLYGGIVWYIGPFFWGSILLYTILQTFKRRTALLIAAGLIYLFFALRINIHIDELEPTTRVFFASSMLRVLAGLSWGILIGVIKERTFPLLPRPSTKIQFWSRFVAISICEIGTGTLLLRHFVVGRNHDNMVTTLILFSVLFLCLVSSGGLLSRLLSWRPLAYMGRYAYSIYVMQQFAFWLMARAYWKSHPDIMQNYPEWSIIVSLACSLLVGVITYHLIEAPAYRLYSKCKRKA